jgi:hypothetical protein
VNDKLEILICEAIRNGALKADQLPDRLKFFNWGENATIKGPVVVNDLTLAVLEANQKAVGYERIAIDFEHCTVPGTPAYKSVPVPRPIAGYGRPIVIPLAADRSNFDEAGVWLVDCTWTPTGERGARNYEDISPATIRNGQNVLVFLHSAGLVPNGAVEGLTFLGADPDFSKLVLSADSMPENKTRKETKMDAFRKLWCKLLGKDEAIKDEELMSEIEKKISELNNSAAAITEMSAEIVALKARLDGLSESDQKRERELIVMGAMLEGKVIPMTADQILRTSAADLRGVVDKLPKGVVPMSAVTPAKVDELPAGQANHYADHVKRVCGGSPAK